MQVLLERKDTVTPAWHLVAKFNLGIDAIDAAMALSKLDGGTYRSVDTRWQEEEGGPLITTYEAGWIQS